MRGRKVVLQSHYKRDGTKLAVMSKNKVVNQQKFQDGKIVLYQLEGRPQKLWLCRIKIPKGKGYVYRGTGVADLYKARKFADDLLDELRFKSHNAAAVSGKQFAKLYLEFESWYRNEAPSETTFETKTRFLKTYVVPYFSTTTITDLTSAEIEKFFDWRKRNGKRKEPKNTSILHEMSCLKTFLDWAHRRGYLINPIELHRPKNDAERRPHFDARDWTKLTRFLREWIKGAQTKSGPIVRDRTMLTNYVLILANTGIRVGEARNLRWRDVDTRPSEAEDKDDNVILYVKGKTGVRDVVARTSEVKAYFDRIWELRCDELSEKPSREGFIFCHKNGKQIENFKKGYSALLDAAGVALDHQGQKRTLYSLRHTYATFRLHEGVNQYALARNMGTSVQMLETFYGHTTNQTMATELTKNKGRQKKALLWE